MPHLQEADASRLRLPTVRWFHPPLRGGMFFFLLSHGLRFASPKCLASMRISSARLNAFSQSFFDALIPRYVFPPVALTGKHFPGYPSLAGGKSFIHPNRYLVLTGYHPPPRRRGFLSRATSIFEFRRDLLFSNACGSVQFASHMEVADEADGNVAAARGWIRRAMSQMG